MGNAGTPSQANGTSPQAARASFPQAGTPLGLPGILLHKEVRIH